MGGYRNRTTATATNQHFARECYCPHCTLQYIHYYVAYTLSINRFNNERTMLAPLRCDRTGVIFGMFPAIGIRNVPIELIGFDSWLCAKFCSAAYSVLCWFTITIIEAKRKKYKRWSTREMIALNRDADVRSLDGRNVDRSVRANDSVRGPHRSRI